MEIRMQKTHTPILAAYALGVKKRGKNSGRTEPSGTSKLCFNLLPFGFSHF
jgi:hypothetical protein